MDNSAERIRALNDALRVSMQGGKFVMTRGVAALDPERLAEVLTTLRGFTKFTPDNDPYGEHDCASFEVRGSRYMFKIDYYDRNMEFGSEDPSDPDQTTRVLTVMLTEEY